MLNTIEFQEFIDNMNVILEHILFWSKSTMQRHLALLEKLIKFHEQHPSLAACTDQIFKMETLIKCFLCYLTARVTISQPLCKRNNNAKSTRISWPSLRTIHDDLLALIINFCPGVNQERMDEWLKRMNNHCQYPVEIFKMIET
ncbi:uncharacterized protein ARMOST_00589 [Armillaria ostoyae]|uniref:Uncharacterized protein n=1 Tax=Armillaria ostoyae TaxID=47428 RepID=A0A284QLI9_ARMOS|nr:uncharacterized protein ARMOST_00589 [Armillaria ostoyae]